MIAWKPMRERAEGCIATTSFQAEVEVSPTREIAEVEETELGPTDEHLFERTPKTTPSVIEQRSAEFPVLFME
jgi:hypothetical protein